MRAVNLKKMKRAGSCKSNNSSNPQTEQESNQPLDAIDDRQMITQSSEKCINPKAS